MLHSKSHFRYGSMEDRSMGLGGVKEGSESSTPAGPPNTQFQREAGLTGPSVGRENVFSGVLPTLALCTLIIACSTATRSRKSRDT